GVERALGEELGAFDGLGLALERLDEFLADDLALLLRVAHAGQLAEELLAGVAGAKVDLEVVAEGGLDEVAFVLTEQAVVDEDADELVADRLVEQGRDDGGIDAAREAADHLAGLHLLAHAANRLLDEVAHRPVAGALADLVDEVFEEHLAARRVGNLRVELHTIERPALVPG